MLKRLWCEDEGVLTFEWIMLLTLLVIGVIGGVAGIRDAIIHEAQSVVGAIVSLDQSYTIVAPLAVSVSPYSGSGGTACTSSASSSGFHDTATWASGRATLGSLPQVVSPNGTLCTVN